VVAIKQNSFVKGTVCFETAGEVSVQYLKIYVKGMNHLRHSYNYVKLLTSCKIVTSC